MTLRLLAFLLILFATACSDSNSPAGRAANIDYLKNTLGPIVLNHRDANGDVFDSFEAAHAASGVTLPNRGDSYDHSLVYQKLGPEAFKFHSYGKNGVDDGGGGDDIVVTYTNGAWTP